MLPYCSRNEREHAGKGIGEKNQTFPDRGETTDVFAALLLLVSSWCVAGSYFGSEGWGFESLRARQYFQLLSVPSLIFFQVVSTLVSKTP